jgi:hypothetical protein
MEKTERDACGAKYPDGFGRTLGRSDVNREVAAETETANETTKCDPSCHAVTGCGVLTDKMTV